MGLFDLFKKKTTKATDAPSSPTPSRKKAPVSYATTDNGIAGPTYLEGLTTHIDQPKNLRPDEWRRKLKAANGQTQFGIQYYGKLHADYPELIVGTQLAPALIYAVNQSTGEKILLFDGCKHGYTAMFVDTYTRAQIDNRQATKIYQNKSGNDSFEIEFSINYQFDFDGEMKPEVNAQGLLELLDGSMVSLETAKRNGFDNLDISAKDAIGNKSSFLSEELA